MNAAPIPQGKPLTMLDTITPQTDSPRPRDGYCFLVDTFSATLPALPQETPEIRYQHMQAAIATVASLCPVGLAEARLAARFVAADEHASECLRQVNKLLDDPLVQQKCRAQFVSMARQSESALRTLMRLQAIRLKRDANTESADAAVWAEHIVAHAMTRALGPDAGNSDAGTRSETPAPSPPDQVDAPPAGELSEVELYEAIYPERAALIRRHGGVPANVSFGPPEPELVQALLARRPRPDKSTHETKSQYS